VRLQFLQRPLGDAEILNKGPRILSPMPFRDIGRNGSRSPPDLLRQSKRLLPREAAGKPVARLGQCHRVLPDPQVAVRIDHWIVQRPSLLAIPYSLFAFFAFSSPGRR